MKLSPTLNPPRRTRSSTAAVRVRSAVTAHAFASGSIKSSDSGLAKVTAAVPALGTAKKPGPTSSSPRRTRSSTAAARAGAVPRAIPPSPMDTLGSTAASLADNPSLPGTVKQCSPTRNSSRFARSSAATAQSVDTSAVASSAGAALVIPLTTNVASRDLGPGSHTLEAVPKSKLAVASELLAQGGQATDKLLRLLLAQLQLVFVLAEAMEELEDAGQRLLAARNDAASADCRLVEGRMVRRGDRQAWYKQAHRIKLMKAQKAHKQSEAMLRRLMAYQASMEEAEQIRAAAMEEIVQAERNWAASF